MLTRTITMSAWLVYAFGVIVRGFPKNILLNKREIYPLHMVNEAKSASGHEEVKAGQADRDFLLKELFSNVQDGEDMSDVIARETIALYRDPLLLGDGGVVQEPPEGVEGDLTTISYLQNELKIPEDILENMLLKYSWILYLKVDTNLKPTIEVLKGFGFRASHIRQMVSAVPSILAINHQFTLPEKLISLQTIFNLSKGGLVKLCTGQPLLLTCSIERNMDVKAFLEDTMHFSTAQIASLITSFPRLVMTGMPVMEAAYRVLSEIYGFNEEEVRYIVLRCPMLLTRATLNRGPERLDFFNKELGLPLIITEDNLLIDESKDEEARDIKLGMDSGGLKKAILRFPALLHIDMDVFLRPNIDVLKWYLELDDPSIAKLMVVFPQLLGHNPLTLAKYCENALWLLTGQSEYDSSLGPTGIMMRDINAPDMVSESELGQGLFETLTTGMTLPDTEGSGNVNPNQKAISTRKATQRKAAAKSKQTADKLRVEEAGYHGYEGLDLIGDIVQGSDEVVGDIREAYNRAVSEVKAIERTALDEITAVTHREQEKTSTRGERNREPMSQRGDVRTMNEDSVINLSRAKVDLDRFKKRSLRRRLLERRKQSHVRSLMAMAGTAAENNETQKMKKAGPLKDEMLQEYGHSGEGRGHIAESCAESEQTLKLTLEQQTRLREICEEGLRPFIHGRPSSIPSRTEIVSENKTLVSFPPLSSVEINAARLLQESCRTLRLDKDKARSVVASSPWILAYRSERSCRVLAALALSLGMSTGEISKCVAMYPRLLSLSVEGKLADVLRSLTRAAADMYEESIQASLESHLQESVHKVMFNGATYSDNGTAYRNDALSFDHFKQTHTERKIERKLLAAQSLGAAAKGDIEIAEEMFQVAKSDRIKILETQISSFDAEQKILSARETPTDSQGRINAGLEADASAVGDTQTHASDQVQLSDDSMVRTYWEQCEAVGVSKDDRIAAAIISVHNRRRNTVRAMVRGLVLRYPLILGTSLARIDERLLELKTDGHLPPLDTMGWPDVINFIRRAPPAHRRWLDKGRMSRHDEK